MGRFLSQYATVAVTKVPWWQKAVDDLGFFLFQVGPPPPMNKEN